MRYSERHKAQTHQRILDEASRRFRRDGIGATGVQALMEAVGLTHGAFYAHFASKDALVEEVLRSIARDAGNPAAAAIASDDPLRTFIDVYLTPLHRDTPEIGCPLPTMSLELAQRGTPSPETDSMVVDRLEALERALARADAGDQSVAMLASLVGALVLARSVADPALSDRILDATRRWLLARASS
jgi:TetR/AcrR family transcriptional repressor of nem operon